MCGILGEMLYCVAVMCRGCNACGMFVNCEWNVQHLVVWFLFKFEAVIVYTEYTSSWWTSLVLIKYQVMHL